MKVEARSNTVQIKSNTNITVSSIYRKVLDPVRKGTNYL